MATSASLSRCVSRAMRQATKHRKGMEQTVRLETAVYDAAETELLAEAPQRLWSKVMRRVQASQRHELERSAPHIVCTEKRASQSALRQKARQQMLEQLGAGHRLVF